MSKETQNKWEDSFMMKYCGELYKQEVTEDFRGFRDCYQEVKDFISQEIEKAYQRGKEEKLEEAVKIIENLPREVFIKADILQQLNKLKGSK